MNLSAEKRRMPRMQVDLPACIFWGIAKNRSEVNVRNLSIHGLSFCAKKYFARGTRFNLIIPNQRKASEINNIQAEVVRCERLRGFSSEGGFKVGAKFSFKGRRSIDSEEKPATETLLPPQSIVTHKPLLNRYNERLKNYAVPANARMARRSSALRIGGIEINAELFQSVRTDTKEETIVTSIQIKQARFTSSPSTSSPTMDSSKASLTEIESNSPLTNLARLGSDKRLL
jgi:hypothetical protein